MFEVLRLSADQVLPLRGKILRPNQPIDNAKYVNDNFESTMHFACKQADQIICVATFMPESVDGVEARKPYRLRGMATDTAFQGQGLGAKIILVASENLRKMGCDLIWCHARKNAYGFYQKLGFETIDGEFDVAGIGPHKVMYKYLFL